MKIYLVFLFITAFTIITLGQQKDLMSDAKFDGLKGKVKSVRYEWAYFKLNGDVSVKKGQYYYLTTYDENGNKIESTRFENNTPTYKTTYWWKNGELFYKGQSLSAANQLKGNPPQPPLGLSGKTTEQEKIIDSSFDNKIKPKFDEKGNLVEKLNYGNNGVFNNRRTFEYDGRGNKLKEIVYTGDEQLYNDSTKFSYDSKGLIIEEFSFLANTSRKESMAIPNRKLTYEYVKVDEKGNWLERKVYEVMRRGIESEPKLISVEYQIINYYSK